MQPQTKQLARFFKSWIINTVAVLLAVVILRDHISYGNKLENLLIASFLLGVLNVFVRPALMLIALPLLIFTLGLFTIVINALLLGFLTILLPFFKITSDGIHFSFGYAILGALIISFISMALNILTGNTNARITIQRRPPPDKKPDDDGKGPVIEV